ncbi:hypothetical protein NIIDMKKI_00570 [Mycobacterium kansasii]|uniref:NAD-dependent epimerase/dehydratase n=1 Tax=Mycobacterium kansasii TaxID=1768 RepID=A0A7G1I1B5_MYCKA|nr:hypothetical protein NIIDMKKI_00570 [Mycobacterium kansasii]
MFLVTELTVLEVAELIRALADSGSTIEFGPPAVDDPPRRCPDITLARRRLGWWPRVDHRTGLSRTLQWLRMTPDHSRRVPAREPLAT